MAKVVLIKDLAEISPSTVDIILSTIINDNSIKKHDATKVYNVGDRVYQIIDGKIVVKECIVDGTMGDDFITNWITVENVIGGGSSTQNPNKFQDISFFEKKLSDDISILTDRLGSILDLSDEGLKGTFMFPLFTSDEIELNGGLHEFGRVII